MRKNSLFPTGRRGFTFAEVLAAMIFMAIVLPVAVNGILVAHRAAAAAEGRRTAARLADGLLAEMVVTGEWRDAETSGDFGEEWPGYEWEIRDEAWDEDGIRLLEADVSYVVQMRVYHVVLSTLVRDEEETDGEEEES